MNIDTSLYTIKYSLDNKTFDLEELPTFKEVGEYYVYYKITNHQEKEKYGNNKVAIYGIKEIDSSLLIKDSILVTKENSFSSICTKIKTFSKSSIYTHYRNNSLIEENTLFTGDKLVININNQKDFEYIIAVLGDVNSDGKISSADYVKIRKHIMGTDIIDKDLYFYASDVNKDNKISSADYVKIRK